MLTKLEIIGHDFMCNLSEVHLNQLDPFNFQEQVLAFQAATISVASLLHHEFTNKRLQESRQLDPIVGVSFTGLFDYFVKLFGVEWLHWWEIGRPHTDKYAGFVEVEKLTLITWRNVVFHTLTRYCEDHGLKMPNRYTTVQPSGSKSLLTGASPGWHPPIAARYIRRVTFGAYDAVAMACKDMGYSVIPSQSDKDENGQLLDDIYDPRCTEWLVEFPEQTGWADLEGADQIDISKFSALAQFDFLSGVQVNWTGHNSSATIMLRENEIEGLAQAIHQNIDQDGGYISAALLARFDSLETFPRLPFEPIDRVTYDRLVAAVETRRVSNSFAEALAKYDKGLLTEGGGSAPCDSDKCLLPEIPIHIV